MLSNWMTIWNCTSTPLPHHSLETHSSYSVLDDAPKDIVAAVDFKGLRHAFKKLQRASHKLDKEKAAAEKHFKKLLDKLPKRATSFGEQWWQRVLCMLKGKRDPVREFIKAAKRVQKANVKLVAFEKGFLHEDGIKDREWYRHLIIAPGKWLGKYLNHYFEPAEVLILCF